MKRTLWAGALTGLVLAGSAACDRVQTYNDRGDGGTDLDASGDTDVDTDTDTGAAIDGVDLLLMIDNSSSMAEEQAMLATSMYSLVSALTSPLPTAAYGAVDELRIAVITSNMGFSSNSQNNDAYWPIDVPANCQGFGDNGLFQGIAATAVEIANDTVPCDETAAQCPDGWTCAGIDGDTGVGTCHTDAATGVECPSMADPWTETTVAEPNDTLEAQAACLTQQGTDGCGWEQQLSSVYAALENGEQLPFIYDTHLLAVLVVTDEDDCSMQDGEAMFGEEEVADQAAKKVNLACGEHPEHLFTPDYFYEWLLDIKGNPNRVVFSAVTGVPYAAQDPMGALECQGLGNQLDGCLEQDAMQLVAEQPDGDTWYFRPACTRAVDAVEITKAYPGRRFVELANGSFGANSFIFSICNEDWSPAFESLNAMIAEKVE
jgi:hypothetical protein